MNLELSPLDLELAASPALTFDALVGVLATYYTDLSLPALRTLATFWLRVMPLWWGTREAGR